MALTKYDKKDPRIFRLETMDPVTRKVDRVVASSRRGVTPQTASAILDVRDDIRTKAPRIGTAFVAPRIRGSEVNPTAFDVRPPMERTVNGYSGGGGGMLKESPLRDTVMARSPSGRKQLSDEVQFTEAADRRFYRNRLEQAKVNAPIEVQRVKNAGDLAVAKQELENQVALATAKGEVPAVDPNSPYQIQVKAKLDASMAVAGKNIEQAIIEGDADKAKSQLALIQELVKASVTEITTPEIVPQTTTNARTGDTTTTMMDTGGETKTRTLPKDIRNLAIGAAGGVESADLNENGVPDNLEPVVQSLHALELSADPNQQEKAIQVRRRLVAMGLSEEAINNALRAYAKGQKAQG